MDKIGVAGAGMMGAEIALCFAMAGNEVTMKDATLELAQKGKERLLGVLDKAIQKGRVQVREKNIFLNHRYRTLCFMPH